MVFRTIMMMAKGKQPNGKQQKEREQEKQRKSAWHVPATPQGNCQGVSPLGRVRSREGGHVAMIVSDLTRDVSVQSCWR